MGKMTVLRLQTGEATPDKQRSEQMVRPEKQRAAREGRKSNWRGVADSSSGRISGDVAMECGRADDG
jgi:hypothetical protein